MSSWLSLRCLKLIILSSDIYFFCVLHGIVTMHWISQAITLDITLTPPLIPSVVFFFKFFIYYCYFLIPSVLPQKWLSNFLLLSWTYTPSNYARSDFHYLSLKNCNSLLTKPLPKFSAYLILHIDVREYFSGHWIHQVHLLLSSNFQGSPCSYRIKSKCLNIAWNDKMIRIGWVGGVQKLFQMAKLPKEFFHEKR